MTGRLVGQSHAPRPATPTFSWHVAVVALLSIACLSWLPLRAQSDRSPLIDATRAQEIDTVRTLILSGADVTARQGDGATALHWAVHWEHPVLVNLLLQAGGDADAANDLGMTPLLMATTRGNSRIVQALLDAGADVTHRAPGGETPLMLAARIGDLYSVENLLAAGAPVNATEDTRGQSALMWAAANAYPRIVAVLLEHGANIESRSRVSSRVFNMGGSRSAGSASRGIRLEEVPQGGGTPLLFAARSGDRESARLLLDHGADANDAAADGNTALAIAAHSGNASVATTLLVAGADPNLAPLGYTPLHAAVLRGTLVDRGVQNPDPHAGVPLLRELLAYGADPNAQLMRGTPVRRWSHDFALMERWVGATPYWLAAKFLEPEMMQLLAASGANTQLASRDGTTPLMAASGLGYSRGGGSAFIKDRRDFSSYNPVESAALGSEIPLEEQQHALEAVVTALALGANVSATDQTGNTALHAAAAHGMDKVIETLVSHGADTQVTNERGQTPAALAVYADGIAGDRRVRKSTAALLQELRQGEHPIEPHRHPESHTLVNSMTDAPTRVANGAANYARLCASCHGSGGRGDGPVAAATAAYGRRPSNLTDTVWQHGAGDGEIFRSIQRGFLAESEEIMAPFGHQITNDEIWELVLFIRTLS